MRLQYKIALVATASMVLVHIAAKHYVFPPKSPLLLSYLLALITLSALLLTPVEKAIIRLGVVATIAIGAVLSVVLPATLFALLLLRGVAPLVTTPWFLTVVAVETLSMISLPLFVAFAIAAIATLISRKLTTKKADTDHDSALQGKGKTP